MIYEHLSAKIVLSRARRRALHRRHSSLAKARFGSADYYPFPFSSLPLSLASRNALIAIMQVARVFMARGYCVFDKNRKFEALVPRYHLIVVLKEIAMIPNQGLLLTVHRRAGCLF